MIMMSNALLQRIFGLKQHLDFSRILHMQSRIFFLNAHRSLVVINSQHLGEAQMTNLMDFMGDLACIVDSHTVCINVCEIPHKTDFKRNIAYQI